jgi:uncharacterized membrane protein
MATLNEIFNPRYRPGPQVHPFDYNPSAWSQRVPVCMLATVGFLVAITLGLYQWKLIDHVWDPFFEGTNGLNGSEAVVTSQTSKHMEAWLRIPDGVLGAIAYLGDALFGLAGSTRRWQYRPWLVVVFGIDVIPLGVVGVILVFMQGFVVGHWCTLCLTSAVISLILVYMAYDEVWSCLIYLNRVRKRAGGLNRTVWEAFCGIPNQIGYEVGEEMTREIPGRHLQKAAS